MELTFRSVSEAIADGAVSAQPTTGFWLRSVPDLTFLHSAFARSAEGADRKNKANAAVGMTTLCGVRRDKVWSVAR